MVSVTSKVQYKDVEASWFSKVPPATYRVIDTPGFFDTTMSQEQVAQALKEFASVAREGLAAILIVVRNGRFTEENQAVLKFVELVLGREALSKYGVLVVTHTDKGCTKLKHEFEALPEYNLGRQIAGVVQGRIVSVGPDSDVSNLYKQIECVFAHNKYKALDCDMMNFERVKLQQEKEYEEVTRALRDAHAIEKEHLQDKLRMMEDAMRRAEQQNDYRVQQLARPGDAFWMGVRAVAAAAVVGCSLM